MLQGGTSPIMFLTVGACDSCFLCLYMLCSIGEGFSLGSSCLEESNARAAVRTCILVCTSEFS